MPVCGGGGVIHPTRREKMAYTYSVNMLATKCERLTVQDHEWMGGLPAGWFTSRVAACLWEIGHKNAWERLDMLRCAGLVTRGGNGQRRLWRVA